MCVCAGGGGWGGGGRLAGAEGDVVPRVHARDATVKVVRQHVLDVAQDGGLPRGPPLSRLSRVRARGSCLARGGREGTGPPGASKVAYRQTGIAACGRLAHQRSPRQGDTSLRQSRGGVLGGGGFLPNPDIQETGRAAVRA